MNYLGHQTGANPGSSGAGQLDLGGPFTATESGKIATIEFYHASDASSNHVKMVVYADAAGVPGARIDYTGPVEFTAAGWVSGAAVLGAQITAGGKYWIGLIGEYGPAMNYDTPAAGLNIAYLTGQSYAAGPPDPAPTMTNLANYCRQVRLGYNLLFNPAWAQNSNILMAG